ncbi:response regulator [Methylobacter sp. G7]|uniref:response regulator n=1 Tax=Methylobacter sp. G7 TaxID=3230117 RepID=UPI003D800FB5
MKEKVPATILVVDDDEWSRNLLLTILTQENYEPISASGGIEAINLLHRLHQSKRDPSLILMDMMMPQMNGMETTLRIKAIERFSAIPIIMVTGNSDKNVIINCLTAGAADFLVKPFNRDTLLDRICKSLKYSAVEVNPFVLDKSWRNSDLIDLSDAARNKHLVEISWLQLKAGMKVVSIHFDAKPYLRNCILDQKKIDMINKLRENSGYNPVIKILSFSLFNLLDLPNK